MRLLTDEMYPPAIAEQLRRRGHDVLGVIERPELRSATDVALFAIAQEEQRVVVTENCADFVPVADATDQRRAAHHGLVLVDPAKYPRGERRMIGRMVNALHRLLREHPEIEPNGARYWL